MMIRYAAVLAGALVMLWAGSAATQTRIIRPEEAGQHTGKDATVCGVVAGTYFVNTATSAKKPTFLFLNKPYPRQPFSVIIWREDRGKFPKPPDTYYKNINICVRGIIVEEFGKPSIVVKDPRSIVVK